MYGVYKRLLNIDLSCSKAKVEPLSSALLKKYMGGKGLATHLLLEKNKKGVDPLSPENHLIFVTGPFCQSRLWGGSRYGVYTKSPQTGFYSESYSGGKVPEAIDSAGYDAIIITGKAKKPVVVSIHPGGAEFFDAVDL